MAMAVSIRVGSTVTEAARTVEVRRPATRADVPAMRAMTRGAFGLTRFAVDPFFLAQVANAAVLALYERAGFTLDHTELTFTTTQNLDP